MKRLLVLFIAAVLLQAIPAAPAQTETQGFWDEFLLTIPAGTGGTFIAVQGNETIFFKNFGTTTPSSEIPVDNRTYFMAGTLGESIIAALALDLHEQGKLNLSAPVVDFIPDLPFDYSSLEQNITVEQILLHRSGMENLVFGNWVEDENGIVDLHEFLVKRLPRVIWKPGTVLSPSSANFALAALVIENITNTRFEEYAARAFFEPAGMNNSGFGNTAPPGKIAEGITTHGGIVRQKWVNLYPTFGFYTTPQDFEHLVKQYNQKLNLLLNRTIFNKMWNTTSWKLPIASYGLGLAQEYLNGTRILVKIGENKGFSSAIYVDPENNVTVGILINRENAFQFNKAIRVFWKHFFPENFKGQEYPIYEPEGFFSLRRFTGIYRETDFVRSTFEKSLMISTSRTLRQEPLEIGINTMEDKLVSEVTIFETDFEYIWTQVNETVFVQENSTEFLIFIEIDDDVYIYTSMFGMPQYFEKIPFLQADSTQLALLIFSEGIFGIGLLMVFMIPRFRKVYLNRRNHLMDRLPYIIMVQGGSINIIFPLIFNSAVESIPQTQFVYDIPTLIKILLLLPIMSVFMFMTFCSYLWVARKDLGDKKQKLFYLVYGLGSLTYIYILGNLNLLGYQY